MATVPLTDKRRSDFLEGAQFAVCPIICGSNGLDSKKKKERFMDEGIKIPLRLLAVPFLCLLISRQSLVSVAGCLSSVWSAEARFSG